MVRRTFSDPSIGSITTWLRGSSPKDDLAPLLGDRDERGARSASLSSSAKTTSSQRRSSTSVLSPPSPMPSYSVRACGAPDRRRRARAGPRRSRRQTASQSASVKRSAADRAPPGPGGRTWGKYGGSGPAAARWRIARAGPLVCPSMPDAAPGRRGRRHRRRAIRAHRRAAPGDRARRRPAAGPRRRRQRQDRADGPARRRGWRRRAPGPSGSS